MPRSVYKTILIFLLLVAGVFALLHTNTIQRFGGSTDMRNRVVGARLMKDGVSPYFYHWHPGDPVRYVIEYEIDTLHTKRVSMITSSPAFHRMLMPVSGLDETVINRIFFVLFYALLAIMAIMTWYESKHLLLTLLFFMPFLWSDGWCFHVLMGQIYFLFCFLFFLISIALIKKNYVLAGILFAALILLRLNSIVFLIPFLLMFRRYKVFIASLAAGLMLYGILFVASPFERKNWTDYFDAIKGTTALHLGFLSSGSTSAPSIASINIESYLPKVFEGEDIEAMKVKKAQTPETKVSAVPSNFFLIYKTILKKAPSAFLLNAVLGICILSIIVILFFKKQRKWNNDLPIAPLLLSGLLCYMLSCFMAPIITFPYQMPQWMTVASLIIIFQKQIPKGFILFFLLGILVDSIFVPDFQSKHVLSEMIFITATCCIILFGRWTSATKEIV